MRKYLLAFSSIVIAIALVSFTQLKKSSTDTFYYEYLGSTTNLSDYQEPSNWTGPISQGSAGCSSNNLPCEVMSSIGDKTNFVQSITDESVVDDHVFTRKP